ncbi:MAG: Qat anti-phage system associated protein QatB [Pyrinomonadaceae bacterium]
MGTSNSNSGTRGSGTPLVPSWIETPPGAGDAPIPANGPIEQVNPSKVDPVLAPVPPPGPPERFTGPRSNFSRFASSGGTNRAALGRSISDYVSKSTGGARNAARKMGSSRVAGGRLLSFLSDVSLRGIQEALRTLKLDSLVGRSIEDVFIGVSDFVCPEGGNVDTNIAREAYFATIAELAANGITDFENLTFEQIQVVFEIFATNAIEARILNDIGNKVISVPESVSDSFNVQEQLEEFIRNAIADALTAAGGVLQGGIPDKAIKFVDDVYERAFTLLQIMGNRESEAV